MHERRTVIQSEARRRFFYTQGCTIQTLEKPDYLFGYMFGYLFGYVYRLILCKKNCNPDPHPDLFDNWFQKSLLSSLPNYPGKPGSPLLDRIQLPKHPGNNPVPNL